MSKISIFFYKGHKVYAVWDEENNQWWTLIEKRLSGLANLYGVFSLKDTKSYLANNMSMPIEAATELFNIVLPHSLLLPHLLHKMTDTKEIRDEGYNTCMGFCSRYGWDSTTDLAETIAHRDDKIPSNKKFTTEEIIRASASIPAIPNDHTEDFAHFLRSRLGYSEDETNLICHNLWLQAQHEEDPDNPHGTYLDYFTKEVIADARKRPQLKDINESMTVLRPT